METRVLMSKMRQTLAARLKEDAIAKRLKTDKKPYASEFISNHFDMSDYMNMRKDV